MKVQQIRDFGDPSAFESADIPRPEPGPNQILVRQVATSVNPVDTKIRANGPPIAPPLPVVLGCDVAGIVETVGSKRFNLADVADAHHHPESGRAIGKIVVDIG